MKITSYLILGVTAVLMGGLVYVTFFHINSPMISQDSTAQICCQNLTNSTIEQMCCQNGTSPLGNFTSAKGEIVSLQNSEAGNSTWIVSGSWNLSKINSSEVTFSSRFEMVKNDSSEKHKYRITAFKLINSSIHPKVATINGTADMRLGTSTVEDVPVSIRLMDLGSGDQTLSIWIDPARVQNHFGNTPIYGIVTKLIL